MEIDILDMPFVTEEQKFRFWQEAKAEIKTLRADAKRYRWIRSVHSDVHIMFGTYDLAKCYADLTSALCGNTLDEAVDKAMKGQS
jgi:hypothetical protein